ncbi:MAG: hypothetical protein R6X09_11645 [Bacteroidales bacterium]
MFNKIEFILAAVTIIWAIGSFILTRKKELAWKRTEFIVQQSEFLDTDKDMREVTLILYGKHTQKNVSDFITLMKQSKLSIEDEDFIMKFEKYLNFLWRISYAYLVLNTLSKKDMNAFGAYFKAVYNHKELNDYCCEDGYEEIIIAYRKLRSKRCYLFPFSLFWK